MQTVSFVQGIFMLSKYFSEDFLHDQQNLEFPIHYPKEDGIIRVY